MLDINISVIYNIINIFILFLLLKKFLFKPVLDIIEKRQGIIEAALNDAKVDKEKASELKLKYEETLNIAKGDAEAIINNAKQKAEEEYENAIKLAEDDARLVMERANKAIDNDRANAVRLAKDELSEIALMAAKKIVKKEVDEDSNTKMLEEFLANVGGSNDIHNVR